MPVATDHVAAPVDVPFLPNGTINNGQGRSIVGERLNPEKIKSRHSHTLDSTDEHLYVLRQTSRHHCVNSYFLDGGHFQCLGAMTANLILYPAHNILFKSF